MNPTYEIERMGCISCFYYDQALPIRRLLVKHNIDFRFDPAINSERKSQNFFQLWVDTNKIKQAKYLLDAERIY